jgi:hypothetical protein
MTSNNRQRIHVKQGQAPGNDIAEERMRENAVIFVGLMNEGTLCWKPVPAIRKYGATYELQGSVPEDEDWQFRPGDTVKCVSRQFQDGTTGLVAFEIVE